MFIIYKATSPNGKCYIGFTGGTLKRRAQHHKANANRYKTIFAKAIRHHGFENFTWEVIFESWDREYCLEVAEVELIKTYDCIANGYNVCVGGNTGPTLPGKLNGMYGKTHSDEFKQAQGKRASQRFKGKSYEELYGAEKSGRLKLQRSEALSVSRKKSARSKPIHTESRRWVHKDGSTFAGTTVELSDTYHLNLKRVTDIINDRRLSYYGWSLMQ